MIYINNDFFKNTWILVQSINIDVFIFGFLGADCVMNCKLVSSFFTRNLSFTKFFGLFKKPCVEDITKLKDLFKKRSYEYIDLSVFSGRSVINVQKLVDYIISQCSTDRLKELDLSLCTEMKRFPSFPHSQYGEVTELFDLNVYLCSNRSILVHMVGCFKVFKRELYPVLHPCAVVVLFCASFYCSVKFQKQSDGLNSNEPPYIFFDMTKPLPSVFPRVSLQYVRDLTFDDLDENATECTVVFGRNTFVMEKMNDTVLQSPVWKITAFY